jgi:hypothetical protein
MFLNDIEMHLQQSSDAGFTPDQLSLYLLLLIVNAVLFSKTKEDLQDSLNNLKTYC